jgi:hypothetical protein
MFSVMHVKREHVSFIKVAVHVGLFTPVIVSDLLPYLPSLSADGHIPIWPTMPEANVFDWIPKILPECRILQKTPIFVLSE